MAAATIKDAARASGHWYTAREAEVDPEAIHVRHCTDCRFMGGGAIRWGTLVDRAAFNLLRGAPKTHRKNAASGATRLLAFCGTYGASRYGTQADEPTHFPLHLSSARRARDPHPRRQLRYDSALAWPTNLDDLPMISQPRT